MSEGAEGGNASANVTSGVAMKEPRMAPEKPKRKFQELEEMIDREIEAIANRKIERILKESATTIRMGDHVKVGRKEGRVVGVGAISSSEPGVAPAQDHILVQFTNGETKSFAPGSVKVIKQNPQYNVTADLHRRDAETAKRNAQPARRYESMSKYHDLMAKHHEWEGNEEQANEHHKLSAENKELAKSSLTTAAIGGGFVGKYEMNAKERQTRQDYQSRVKIGKARTWSYHHYFLVPFAQKDKAKAAGFMWDQQEKKWYLPSEMRSHRSAGGSIHGWKFSHTVMTATGQRYDD